MYYFLENIIIKYGNFSRILFQMTFDRNIKPGLIKRGWQTRLVLVIKLEN